MVQAATVRRLVLDGVSWREYSRFLRAFEHRRLRLTYDRGRLEIMAPTFAHEGDGRFLGHMVRILADELNRPIAGGGSTTFRRRRRRRGLEPDDCFWIANEQKIRGKRRIDLDVDPSPDLAIEVDVTRSSLKRMAIYAALGVPEVWRFDGARLTFHILGTDDTYTVAAVSRSFPILAPDDLLPFLQMRATQDETTVAKSFRAWVKQKLQAVQP